jgi:FMN reductase
MSVTVVVGNPKPRSRTYEAAHAVAERLTGRPAEHSIDLVELGAGLLDWKSTEVSDAVATVTASELVIVASPTYKGAYTGLLKLFLDRFGGGALAGVKAVPLMLGGDLRHSLAPEVFLKPVLAEIGLSCPTRGLFLIDADWDGVTLAEWLPPARTDLSLTREFA